MWSVMVVIFYPCVGKLTNLLYGSKQICISYIGLISLVKTLYKGILGWLAKLYVFKKYTMHSTPLGGQLSDELRPVVHA